MMNTVWTTNKVFDYGALFRIDLYGDCLSDHGIGLEPENVGLLNCPGLEYIYIHML